MKDDIVRLERTYTYRKMAIFMPSRLIARASPYRTAKLLMTREGQISGTLIANRTKIT